MYTVLLRTQIQYTLVGQRKDQLEAILHGFYCNAKVTPQLKLLSPVVSTARPCAHVYWLFVSTALLRSFQTNAPQRPDAIMATNAFVFMCRAFFLERPKMTCCSVRVWLESSRRQRLCRGILSCLDVGTALHLLLQWHRRLPQTQAVAFFK